MESFQPPVREPAVKGRGDGADGILEKGEAGVEFGGVVGSGAHEDVGVAVDVFCNAVHNDVGTVVERILDIWGEEGIIDDDHDAMPVSDCGDVTNIHEAEGGVAGRFDPDELGLVWPDQIGNAELDGGGKGDLHAVCGGHFGEVAVCAYIEC